MKRLTRTLSLMAIVAVLLNSCKKEESTSCSDGIMNGTETGIDCGGSCDPCGSAASCSDGILNGDETDVDCGGSCPACATCTDGIQNGDETGVDCGGSDCPTCPTCTDGIQNGDETGVDCGGSCGDCVCGVDLVADADGNVYETVQIGTQCWMKENLNTSKYNDGTAIPNITDDQQWLADTQGAYCFYNNDAGFSTDYGKFYNHPAVRTGKLCPQGWHIPSLAEWTVLVNYLGGSSVAGGKMKSSGPLWDAVNLGATNESGFSGLPGGSRDGQNGTYCCEGSYGVFYATDVDNTENPPYAGHLVLNYNYAGVTMNSSNPGTSGYNCRCVND